MDFNTVLQKVGDFGLYQKLLCAFLVVPSAGLCALIYFVQFFIIMVPHHRCRLLHDSEFNQHNLSLPFEERDGQYLPVQCEMYKNSSDVMSNETQPCQNGYIYDFSELYPTIATEAVIGPTFDSFILLGCSIKVSLILSMSTGSLCIDINTNPMDWVCENDRMPYWIQTISYIGTSLGCIVFGLIADRYGRRPSIILSYVVACSAGVGTAFVSSIYTFAAMRFLVGASIIPLSEDPYVLSLEYIGVEKRTLAIVLWAGGYITFSAICPWFAYGLRDWRWLCIVTSVPLALVAFSGILIPESASWLLTQNRNAEAIKMLKTVAKINGREFPEEFEDCVMEKLTNEQSDPSTTVLDLFKTPRLRRNSIILALTWFVVYCCYHTNTQNASNLGTNIYESFTYSALVEIPAQFVIFFGIDWLGRRWPLVFAALLAGFAGLFIMCLPQETPTAFLTLALIQRVTLTVVYNIIIQYSAELYPTVLRGRGLAFLRVMGTLGLYLSPSIVYLALSHPAFPLLVSGVMMLGVSAISLFLPETLRQHLPHTVEDGEKFGADQKVLDFPCLKRKEWKEEDLKEEEL